MSNSTDLNADALRQAEARYESEVKDNLTRNYIAQLLHGMLGQTGFRFVNAPTFLPAYLMMLSDGSEFVVGLGLALQAFGMTLTPIFGASLIEHRKRVLPVGFVIGSGMRSIVLLMAMAGFFLEGQATLIALLVLLGLFGIFEGMQGVVFNFLTSKVIPVSKRGRLSGIRNFLAGGVAAMVAWVGGEYLLGDTPDQIGYSWIFLLAFCLTSCGLLMLLMLREPEPPTVRDKLGFRDRLSEIPALLRSDPAFTRYFLARTMATMGRMAMPFYILYAGQTMDLTGQTLGIITFAFTISATVSNLIWGFIADRKGFRAAYLLSILLWVLSTILLMFADGLVATVVVFVGIGAASQGFRVASMMLTLEFGSRDDLPIRIAIANTASEIAGTLGPLSGGIIAAIWGYESVFILSITFLLIGGTIVKLFVPEPRHAKISFGD